MKQILIFFLAFLIESNMSAQTVAPPAYADVNDDYRTYMNNVFGTLEANRVPTGPAVVGMAKPTNNNFSPFCIFKKTKSSKKIDFEICIVVQDKNLFYQV